MALKKFVSIGLNEYAEFKVLKDEYQLKELVETIPTKSAVKFMNAKKASQINVFNFKQFHSTK